MATSRLEHAERVPALEIFGKEGISSNSDYLATLLSRGKFRLIPTNAGWTQAVAGTGVGELLPFYMYVNTGATASSSSIYRDTVAGLEGDIATTNYIDFDKDLRIFLTIKRVTSVANGICRIQLKRATTEGVLANLGLGLQITNLTLTAEAYGSGGLATNGSQVLVSAETYEVEMRLTAGVKYEVFVDGVIVGTLTGTAMPTGTSGAGMYFVLSAINGATATACILEVQSIVIWQER